MSLQRASTAPFRVLIAVALLFAALVVGAVALVVQPPWLGLNLSADPVTQTIRVDGLDAGGPAALALAQTGRPPVRLTAVDGAALTDIDRIEESDFLPTFAAVDALFTRQSGVMVALRSGPVKLTFEDAAGAAFSIEATPGKRPVGDLPPLFWLQLVFGGGALFIGAWVWSLRPRDLAVQMFALTGVGLLLSTTAAAVYSSRELALDGAVFRLLSAINHLGAFTFGAGMVAVFALYPKRLVKSARGLWAMAAATAAWFVADAAHLAFNPQIGSYLPVMVLTAGIFVLIGRQWWANRSDPRARAALRWLGLSVLVGISGYVFGNALPVLLDQAPVLPQGLLLGSFLLIYIGLALGLGRYRLFQLDQWAYRTVFYTGGVLAVLAADATLIFALQLEKAAALGVALLVIGLLYLPARDMIWRRLTARRRTEPDQLFGWIMEAALAAQAPERATRWRDLMVRLFDPLSIEETAAPQPVPAIADDGLELAIPATAAGPALTLRYARGGRTLFGAEDLATARQAVTLMAQAEASRLAYERGASEERRRIAQDLHDDVGARLLSGLHKPDLPQTRNALREAIADIRMVVGGLAGDRRPLDHVLADLRHEAAERLSAAGIALDWPLCDEESAITVDYVVQKALRSAMREMVSNTIRHAQATKMTVHIETSASKLRLVVADDGVGLPQTPASGDRQGFGLLGLVGRMEALGGALTLPKTEQGLTVDMLFDLSGRVAAPEMP